VHKSKIKLGRSASIFGTEFSSRFAVLTSRPNFCLLLTTNNSDNSRQLRQHQENNTADSTRSGSSSRQFYDQLSINPSSANSTDALVNKDLPLLHRRPTSNIDKQIYLNQLLLPHSFAHPNKHISLWRTTRSSRRSEKVRQCTSP
jgi:hypothetical protein